MNQTGQHQHPLFAGIDEGRPKIFTLEVSVHSTLYALETLEKAIADLRKCSLFFSYEGSTCKKDGGVNATFRYSDGGCQYCSGNKIPNVGWQRN